MVILLVDTNYNVTLIRQTGIKYNILVADCNSIFVDIKINLMNIEMDIDNAGVEWYSKINLIR